jgi:parallel beta-helix repeat protein
MQRNTFKRTNSVLVAATLSGIIWASAGDLNPPPGPVTSTMKTLAEVEPRTAINATNTPGDASATFKISKPGSYYLTGNIDAVVDADAIAIEAGDVTVDLMGFALVGGSGSTGGSGILIGDVSNVEIRNGTIRGFGLFGIRQPFNTAKTHRIIGVRIASNGHSGVHLLGEGHTIRDCTAEGNGKSGIIASIGTTMIGNTALNNVEAGIFAGFGSTVTGNTARSNGQLGIFAGTGSTVTGNTATNNTADGIAISAECRVEQNVCQGNGLDAGSGAGIHATGADNRITGNHLTGADRGLEIGDKGNYVADNTVKGNTDNYDIAAGNQLNILLGEIPESIDWPANVTLAGSLTGAIDTDGLTINADDVTVDLSGHALIGSGGSTGNGITFNAGISNGEIRNGTVSGFGGSGIGAPGTNGRMRVISVRAVSNGAGGIAPIGSDLVKDCTAVGNGGTGIYVGAAAVVTGNISLGNQGHGFVFGLGSVVTGNTARNNQLTGFLTIGDSTIIGNTVIDNGLAGIEPGLESFIDQNNVTGNSTSAPGQYDNIEPCNTCTFGLNHAP